MATGAISRQATSGSCIWQDAGQSRLEDAAWGCSAPAWPTFGRWRRVAPRPAAELSLFGPCVIDPRQAPLSSRLQITQFEQPTHLPKVPSVLANEDLAEERDHSGLVRRHHPPWARCRRP